MQWPNFHKFLKYEEDKRNFSSLMELYESNYIRLRLLIPGLKDLQYDCMSEIKNDMNLYLFLISKQKYGIDFKLGYRFTLKESIEPNVHVRVYFDARTAEAISIYQEKYISGSVLERKWQKNHFLHKWLSYCHQSGHKLQPITSR